MIPRGLRNNNPLNIEYNGTKWRGLGTPPSDGRFCRFVSAAYGYRAAVVILRNYQSKHRLRTLRQMIGRWAPPNENNTRGYIMRVSRRAKIAPDDVVNMHDKPSVLRLLEAMCMVENGVAGNEKDISAGYDLLN